MCTRRILSLTLYILMAEILFETRGHRVHDINGHHHTDHEHHDEHDHNHHHHHHHPTEGNMTAWFCPTGWVPYNDGSNVSCLFFSRSAVGNDDLNSRCKDNLSSKPVVILTESKNDFIMAQAATNEMEYWLPLFKATGYGHPFFWNDDEYHDAMSHYQPQTITEALYVYRRRCVYLSGFSQEWNVDECDTEYNYICERPVDCMPGAFGESCSQDCHCAGEPCDTSLGHANCKWGCERGWAGPSCSEAREHPVVKYFCINSPDEHVGTYVDIHIQTNGINYRSIYATLGNSSEAGPWCDGTTVSSTQQNVDLAIHLNSTVVEEMSLGECVGQELNDGTFEWTLVIQEYENIVLDTDLQVVISCDFNNSETMQRSAGFELDGHHLPTHKVELSPEATDVTLEVVDPYTLQPISEAHLGTPAKLQIKFGYGEGSLVKGVCPHHCIASTPDETVVKPLLDGNGCSNYNSPVSEFSLDTNTTGSISTQWFPLFALEGHQNVQIKCMFDLCIGSTLNCQPGCRHGYSHNRHRRDTSSLVGGGNGQNMEWSTGVIRVLPRVHDDMELDHWPSLRQQPLHMLNIKQDPEPVENRHSTAMALPSTIKAPTTKEDYDQTDLISILNPVTCIIFLVLLVIFLALFLTLHHALFKSITGLRQDLMRSQWQSRDKIVKSSAATV